MAYDIKTNTFTQDEMYVSRRYGRIDISEQFVQSDTEVLLKVFSQLIPLDIKFDYLTKKFNILAMSKQFDPVPEGYQIPYYYVIIHKNHQDEITIEFTQTLKKKPEPEELNLGEFR